MQSYRQKQAASNIAKRSAVTDADINHVLLNGAGISLSKLKLARSFNARLYYYAEIGVFLEVSLSSGAGITDKTRQLLSAIHSEATHLHMQQSKNARLKPAENSVAK